MVASSTKNEDLFYDFHVATRQEMAKGLFFGAEELGFIDWDIANDKTIISPNLRRILDIPNDIEIMCWHDWVNLFHPQDQSAIIEEIEALKKADTNYVTAKHLKKHTNGSNASLLTQTIVLSRDNNNMPTRLLTTCMCETSYEKEKMSLKNTKIENDIIAPNNSISLLQNMENNYNNFIKQIQVPIAILDMDMRYIATSDAWIHVYNLENQGNIIGKSHYDVFPNQPQNWIEAHQIALSGEIYVGGEECYYTPKGKPIWLTGSIYPWYTETQTRGGVIIATEIITKRKNSEQHLSHMVNELMRSNQDLERFAHICSHDLKGPLRSISGFLQLLVRHNTDVFDDTSLMYIPHIVQNINRMDELIKGILEYSKISYESGEHTKVNIALVVNEVIEDLTLKTKQLNAVINIDPLPVIEGEYIKIKQIFSNLIDNSLKFHSHRPPVIDVRCEDNGAFWKFTVRDNGVGIDLDHSVDIFRAFKRLHKNDEYEGTGVGLSIVKKNVNAHGGDIYIQTNPTGGCEFIFTLQKQNKIMSKD